jgi:hypothetical protein
MKTDERARRTTFLGVRQTAAWAWSGVIPISVPLQEGRVERDSNQHQYRERKWSRSYETEWQGKKEQGEVQTG